MVTGFLVAVGLFLSLGTAGKIEQNRLASMSDCLDTLNGYRAMHAEIGHREGAGGLGENGGYTFYDDGEYGYGMAVGKSVYKSGTPPTNWHRLGTCLQNEEERGVWTVTERLH